MRLQHVVIVVSIEMFPGVDELTVPRRQSQRQWKGLDGLERKRIIFIVRLTAFRDVAQGVSVVVNCLDFIDFRQQLRIGRALCKGGNGNEYDKEDNVKLRDHAALLPWGWWTAGLYQTSPGSHSDCFVLRLRC